MNFKRLLNTELGRILISILLGLGLASLFRKVCNDRDCIIFNGPVITELEGKTYKYGEHCYQYSMHADKCDPNKRIIEISSKEEEFQKGILG